MHSVVSLWTWMMAYHVNINTSTVNAFCGFVVDMDDGLSCQYQHLNCQCILWFRCGHGWWLIMSISTPQLSMHSVVSLWTWMMAYHVNINTSTVNAFCGFVVDMDDGLSCQYQHLNCQCILWFRCGHGWWLIMSISTPQLSMHSVVSLWTWMVAYHVNINTSTVNAFCGFVVDMDDGLSCQYQHLNCQCILWFRCGHGWWLIMSISTPQLSMHSVVSLWTWMMAYHVNINTSTVNAFCGFVVDMDDGLSCQYQHFNCQCILWFRCGDGWWLIMSISTPQLSMHSVVSLWTWMMAYHVNINTSTVNAFCGFVVDMDDGLSCQYQHHNCQCILWFRCGHGWWLIMSISTPQLSMHSVVSLWTWMMAYHVNINTTTVNAFCGFVVEMDDGLSCQYQHLNCQCILWFRCGHGWWLIMSISTPQLSMHSVVSLWTWMMAYHVNINTSTVNAFCGFVVDMDDGLSCQYQHLNCQCILWFRCGDGWWLIMSISTPQLSMHSVVSLWTWMMAYHVNINTSTVNAFCGFVVDMDDGLSCQYQHLNCQCILWFRCGHGWWLIMSISTPQLSIHSADLLWTWMMIYPCQHQQENWYCIFAWFVMNINDGLFRSILIPQLAMHSAVELWTWASYQIRKIADCACAGNGAFSPPSLVIDPDMHHGTCLTHVPCCMSGPLTSCFLWNRWRGKRSQHSRRMRNPQFCVSGKRPMDDGVFLSRLTPKLSLHWLWTWMMAFSCQHQHHICRCILQFRCQNGR